jgi:hypothetical protein
MIRKLATLSVLLFAFTGTAQAAQLTVTFNSTGAESDIFPRANWQTLSVNKEHPDYEYSGFKSLADNLPSIEWVAVNSYAYDQMSDAIFFISASETAYDGPLFDLNGFWLASAYGSQTLVVRGFDPIANIHYEDQIDITTTATYYAFNWEGISVFSIDTRTIMNFEKDPRVNDNGMYWVMGNITITPVPEPETYAMLLAGLGIVGVLARRRRTRAVM